MKQLLLFLAVFSVLTVSADERSTEILDKLSNIIRNSGNYRIDFISTVEGHSMEGYYIVSGENYRIHTPEMDIFCADGISYQIDGINKEIVIEPAPEADKGDILSDPVHAFSFLDEDYNHYFVRQAGQGNKTCFVIHLEGKTNKQDIQLYIDAKTSLPLRAEYFLENINSDAIIEVKGFTPRIEKTDIVPDLKRYEYYEIIDFRQ